MSSWCGPEALFSTLRCGNRRSHDLPRNGRGTDHRGFDAHADFASHSCGANGRGGCCTGCMHTETGTGLTLL